MNLLLTQSFEQHFHRARLFEHVGYWLAGLAFVVLAGAVAWRVSQRRDGTARRNFRLVSLAALSLFQLVLGAGLLIHFWWGFHSPPQRKADRVVPVIPVTPAESPGTVALVIHVAADGILSTNGRSIPGDELTAYLAEMTGDWAEQGIRLENVEVDLRIDPRVSHGKVVEIVDTFFKLGITHVRWGTVQDAQPESQVSVEDPRPSG